MNLLYLKRAQVTIFILIAVFILIGMVIYYFVVFNSKGDEIEEQINNEDVLFIRSQIIDCFEGASVDSLILVGSQGGFYNSFDNYIDFGWAKVPYYYDRGEFVDFSFDIFNSELENLMKYNSELCLSSVKHDYYEIDYENLDVDVLIREDYVDFLIDLSVNIYNDDVSYKINLDDKLFSTKSKIKGMFEIANYIYESHKKNPKMMCISCIIDMSFERVLFVDMASFGDNTTAVRISHNDSYSYPFLYEFLNRYS
jgi:hypothetical protein